jgi:hypothetical protein
LPAYTPEYFRDLNLSAGLWGDDYSIIPLEESIDLCGHTVTPVSAPAPANHAVTHVGGGLTAADKRTVIRDVAVYASTADARKPYDAIAAALTVCDLETSKAMSGGSYLVEPLPIQGALAWRHMDRSDDGSITGQEVWVATLTGRSLLVQHVPIAVAPAETSAATSQARALLSHARRLSNTLDSK